MASHKRPQSNELNLSESGTWKRQRTDEIARITAKFETESLELPSQNVSALKQHLHDGLIERMDNIGPAGSVLVGASKQDRVREQQDIIACIGILAVVSDDWLQRMLQLIGDDPLSFLDVVRSPGRRILDCWLQKPAKKREMSAAGRSAHVQNAQKIVRGWYGKKCILTGTTITESCHIVPDSALRHEDRNNTFWAALRVFWPGGDVVRLQTLLKEPRNAVVNLLVLSRNLHGLWGRAQFALRPLDQPEPHKLRLQFLWLGQSRTGAVTYDGDQDPEDRPVEWQTFGRTKPRPIASGDVIQLLTEDAEAYPLPSRDLLELQWHLNRAACAIANADLLQRIFPDDGPNLGELEANTTEENDSSSYHDNAPYLSRYLIDCAERQGVIGCDGAEFYSRLLVAGDKIEGLSETEDGSEEESEEELPA